MIDLKKYRVYVSSLISLQKVHNIKKIDDKSPLGKQKINLYIYIYIVIYFRMNYI